MFKVPEKYRYTGRSDLSTDAGSGNYGLFIVPSSASKGVKLCCIASDFEWEHVSVSIKSGASSHGGRCPTWEEMCEVKNLFWSPTDFVVQMHVPQQDWVNNHNYVLHLWRKAGTNDFCERPPKVFV